MVSPVLAVYFFGSSEYVPGHMVGIPLNLNLVHRDLLAKDALVVLVHALAEASVLT